MSVKIRAIEPPEKLETSEGENIYWTHVTLVNEEPYALVANYDQEPIAVFTARYSEETEELLTVDDEIAGMIRDHLTDNPISLWTLEQIKEVQRG